RPAARWVRNGRRLSGSPRLWVFRLWLSGRLPWRLWRGVRRWHPQSSRQRRLRLLKPHFPMRWISNRYNSCDYKVPPPAEEAKWLKQDLVIASDVIEGAVRYVIGK